MGSKENIRPADMDRLEVRLESGERRGRQQRQELIVRHAIGTGQSNYPRGDRAAHDPPADATWDHNHLCSGAKPVGGMPRKRRSQKRSGNSGALEAVAGTGARPAKSVVCSTADAGKSAALRGFP